MKRYATALLPALLLSVSAHASIVIDDFITVQNAEVDAAAPPDQFAGNSLNTATALGVERDLYVEKTAGGAGERVRARINPNGLDLIRQTVDDASGRVVVTWDGVDGLWKPTEVKYDGLGAAGIDFSNELSLDILVTFSDVGGPIRFKLWDALDLTGATYAETTFTVPGGVPSGSSVLLSRSFAGDFVASVGTVSSILGRVGAIQMEIDSRAVAQEGWDMRLDYVGTTSIPVPEPGSLALVGFALLAAGYARRRVGQ